MKSLINNGHEVTIITSFPEQASAQNYTSLIDVSKKKKDSDQSNKNWRFDLSKHFQTYRGEGGCFEYFSLQVSI